MKNIRKRLLYTVTALVILLSGCTKNEPNSNSFVYTGEILNIDMQLYSSKGATVDDSHIETVRVIVFNDEGKRVFNDLAKIESTQADGVTARVGVARGVNNFYVICNETSDLTTKLSAITKESDIEKTTLQYAAINPPIPMYGKVLKGTVTSNEDGSDAKVSVNGITSEFLSVDVVRLMAKVNLTVIKDVTDKKNNFTVEELRIRVCRMPKHTTLLPDQISVGGEWAENISFTGVGKLLNDGAYLKADDVYTVPDGVDRIEFKDIYIPEHLLAVPVLTDEATYILVDAKCKLESSQVLHYIYIINIGQDPPQNHNIRRNHQYDIYATIKSMGAMGIYAEIMPMDMHDIPINWSPIEGLVIVSDHIRDYDMDNNKRKDLNIWNDYTSYFGTLKIYDENTFKDVLFKSGSVIALYNNATTGVDVPFIPPTSITALGDVAWAPSTYGNPSGKINAWADIPVRSTTTSNSYEDVAKGLGDPCKLVGLSEVQINNRVFDNLQWRMATDEDYKILMSVNFPKPDAHGFRAFNDYLLPNVTKRNELGTLLDLNNSTSAYWATGSNAFQFSSSTDATLSPLDSNSALTVRCVRNKIPASILFAGFTEYFTYKGNQTTGLPMVVSSNVPYWTATLIDDPADSNVGTATEFEDFSFTAGGTKVRTTSGRYNQNIPIYIARKESRVDRTFSVKVEGTGFDGITFSRVVTITQRRYDIRGFFDGFSPELSEDVYVPKEGETYTFSLKISPNDISLPVGKLHVEAYYLKELKATSSSVQTEPTKYKYEGLEITIPRNETPDIFGYIFYIYLDNEQIGDYRYYHDNK